MSVMDRSGNDASGRTELQPSILEEHRIVARESRTAHADVFRMLRTKVLQALSQSRSQTLAITSPNQGDGKSTIAANLALAIAMDVKHHVLLVDLDLRTPNLHNLLGISRQPGVTDCLLKHVALADCLIRPNFPRLLLLGGGTPLFESSELLGSPEMARLAAELKMRYPDRLVIYDMPPLLSQDDTLAFLPNVDSVLLVVRDRNTPEEDLKRCIDWLGETNLIGTVLNDSQDTRFNRRMQRGARPKRKWYQGGETG